MKWPLRVIAASSLPSADGLAQAENGHGGPPRPATHPEAKAALENIPGGCLPSAAP